MKNISITQIQRNMRNYKKDQFSEKTRTYLEHFFQNGTHGRKVLEVQNLENPNISFELP